MPLTGLDKFLLMKRKQLPLSTACQRSKVVDSSPDAKAVEAKLQSFSKMDVNIDATPAVSGALQLESGSAVQVLVVARSEHCFVQDTFVSELVDLFEKDTSSTVELYMNLAGSALCPKVNLRFFNPPNKNCTAQG